MTTHKRNPATAITPDQKTAIKMGQRALNISDEDYRATLWNRYTVESCTDLSREQATDLIEDYISRGFVLIPSAGKAAKWERRQQHPRPWKPAGADKRMRPSHKGSDNVVCMVTAKEIDKVNKLAALIQWRAINGLALFLEKRMGIKKGKIKTSGEAYLAIEGLKKTYANQMKAAHGEQWWNLWFDDVEIRKFIAEHCPDMYRGRGYAITCRSLRPDVYGDIDYKAFWEQRVGSTDNE